MSFDSCPSTNERSYRTKGSYTTVFCSTFRSIYNFYPTVDSSVCFFAQDNLFEWHFTIRGPPGTDFDGGVYHGRIILPPEYPMKPPSIVMLTVFTGLIINKLID